MYPFGSIPSNLVAFTDFLRREYGFKICLSEQHDAARVLEIVDLTNESALRNALRPVLSETSEDVSVFDEAFNRFFSPGTQGMQHPEYESIQRELSEGQDRIEPHDQDQKPVLCGEADEEGAGEAATKSIVPLTTQGPEVAPELFGRGSWSPLEARADGESPQLGPVAPAWLNAARLLVRRLHLGLLRRWQSAARGPRFDLRRTLRASLQTGGEAITARWLRRPRRSPKFVLLVDGSRSMGPFAQTALHLAVAIASVTMRVEVFTFSTGLRCVTKDIRRAVAGEVQTLKHLQHAWAGGTTIGRCLRDFIRRFGARMISRNTVVVIVSDGLDVGETDMLTDAMSELHRRSAAVVWLNPLIETPGYEPTAEGMSAARPYITTFSSANDLAGFVRLSRLVHVKV